MPGFGDRLKAERESGNLTLEEISERTGIGVKYLRALENEEFGSLPGRAFGKLYIRAYAEVLGFDPEALLGLYDREAQNHEAGEPPRIRRPATEETAKEPPEEPSPSPPDTTAPPEPPIPAPERPAPEVPPSVPEPASDPRRKLLAAGLVTVVVVIVAALFYLAFFRADGAEVEPDTTVSSQPTIETAAKPSPEPPPAPQEPEADEEPATNPEPETSAPASALSVSEFGVGRRIVDRRLEGQSDRFEQGSVAWFQTRVIGGRRGESIRHVWLFQGRPVESVSLRLGGPHWRTYSRKTVREMGDWAVEARDAEDRLLARTEFTCVPAAR